MMRVCHLDTCPVGVATQNPALRERCYRQEAEYVVNFFEYIAEEVRELLAEPGLPHAGRGDRRVENLDVVEAVEHWKASGLDLTPILHKPRLADGAALRNTTTADHGLAKALDVTDGAAGPARAGDRRAGARPPRSATSTAPSARSSATR